jgi:hypothetical protein
MSSLWIVSFLQERFSSQLEADQSQQNPFWQRAMIKQTKLSALFERTIVNLFPTS